MEYMDETTLAHKHTSPWLIAFRIIFTIALVWCCLLYTSDAADEL